MQSKKIIAGTMALLMAFGSVAGSVDGIFASNAIVANAAVYDDEVKEDATVDQKLDYIKQVIEWEAERIGDKPSEYGITAINQDGLYKAICAIVERVNGIKNLKWDFAGTVLGEQEVGKTDVVKKEDYNVVLKDYSASGGTTMTGDLELTLDGTTRKYSFKITIPEAEATIDDIAGKVQEAMDKFIETLTPDKTQADFDKVVDDILAPYGATRTNTIYKKDAYKYTYSFTIKYKDDTRNLSWTDKEVSEDSMWADLIKRIKAALPEIEVKAGASDSQVVSDIEALANKINGEMKKFNITATVTERTGYVAPTETATGLFSGKLTITESGGTRSEVIDFSVVLPANPKDDWEMIAEIYDKINETLRDYRFVADKSTTVDQAVKVAQAKAEELGAKLTYTGNNGTVINGSNSDYLWFEYTLEYKTASYPDDLHYTYKPTGELSLYDTYDKATDPEAKKAINDAIAKIKENASNDLTAQSILDTLNVVAKKYGFTLSWDTGEGLFVKRNSDGKGTSGLAEGLLVADGTADPRRATFDFSAEWDAEDAGLLAAVKSALEKYAAGEEQDGFPTYSGNIFYYNNGENDVRVEAGEISEFTKKASNYNNIANVVWTAYYNYTKDLSYEQIKKDFDFAIIGLNVTESTATKQGSVDATVVLTYDEKTTYVPLSFKLPLAISADEQLAKAKPVVEAFLATYAVSGKGANPTTLTNDIIKAIQDELAKYPEFAAIKVERAKKYGQEAVDLTNDENAKKITGTLVLKAGEKTENVNVNIAYTDDYFAAALQIARNVLATWTPNSEAEYKDEDEVIKALQEALDEALKTAKLDTKGDFEYAKTINKLVITKPTDTLNGSIVGQVYFKDANGHYALLDANIVIGKKVDPAELLKKAKDVVEARLASYVVTNDTTEDDILAVAQAALDKFANENGVGGLKAVKDSFTLTPATQDAEGNIKGAVTLSYGGAVEVANFDLKIDKIGANITVDKVVKSDKFTSTTDAVRINWTLVNGADGYRVYVKQANGEYKSVKTLGKGDVNTYRISGLTAGTEYTYKVKAFKRDEAGNPIWGIASDPIVTATRPLATTVTKNTATKDAVRINWVGVYGADGYKVQQYKNGEWVTIKLTSNTNYRVSGLKANTSYKFRVQAFKRVGNTKTYSAWSNTWTASTKK